MEILFKQFNTNSQNVLVANLESNINSDYFYARGFERGGFLLYEAWMRKEMNGDDNTSIDCIIYPIYMCYRQAVELWYKKLIRTFTNEIKTGHKIKELHDYLIKNEKYANYLQDLEKNTDFIEYLDRVDHYFDRFRYDTTREGAKQNDQDEVDLNGMVNGFKSTCSVLEKIWYSVCRNLLSSDGSVQDNHYNRFM